MAKVVVLREGKNFGDHFGVTSATNIFKNMNLARRYLKSQGYVLEEMATGSPLWVNNKTNCWAEPIWVSVKAGGSK